MYDSPNVTGIDSETAVVGLASQYPSELLGVPGDAVRLTWRVTSRNSAAKQISYELQGSKTRDFLSSWRSAGQGDASIAVLAPGDALLSRERRFYRARIETQFGWTGWGPTLKVEAGLLMASDWQASAVGIASLSAGPAPMLRRRFELDDEPVEARLYVTSLGVNDIYLNGTKVSDSFLAPGWTPYDRRVIVRTHDVLGLLRRGSNALAVIVGDGWYRGRLGWEGRDPYGEQLALVAQLEVSYADGSMQTVCTDDAWVGSFGHVRSNGVYDGSEIDFTQSIEGWSEPDFDDSGWGPVGRIDLDFRVLDAARCAPVREVAQFEMLPVAREGSILLDAGQNIAGWVRLVVQGEPGDKITIRHSEILDTDGSLFTLPLRSARATDTYILNSTKPVQLEPIFTFHGFRFAEYVGEAKLLSATAVAISSDLAPRAGFTSSSDALVKLHQNVVWSQRGNFVSLPTDCPQRDERFGWTGDAQAFAFAANTLADTAQFWQSWLIDLAEEQSSDGAVPSVVPNVLGAESIQIHGRAVDVMGRAGWGDAATVVPWSIYISFGDPSVLVRQLPSMRAWVGYLLGRVRTDGMLPNEFQWGDWLDPDAPEPWAAKVPSGFVANAFLVHSARILAKTERLLGDSVAARFLEGAADRVAAAAWGRFGAEAVRSQSGCAVALEFGIAPSRARDKVASALAENVRDVGGRIATGFLGTPLVLHALSNSGYFEEAYMMLLRRESPSWLYQVDVGATTLWERWDALLPDGSVNPMGRSSPDSPDLLSFNHYANGAVVDWIYRNVAGIAPSENLPGYREVRIAPRPTKSITSADAFIDTPAGRAVIGWQLENHRLTISVDVPFGVSAQLDLPVSATSKVFVNSKRLRSERLAHGSHVIVVLNPQVAGI